MTADELVEYNANMIQRIAELETRVRNMTVLRTDAGINTCALEIAREIENIFAQGSPGGVSKRLLRVQVLIRDNMRLMLEGERHWDHS